MNVGVPWLGVPKAFSAMFSGEMRDTAELAPLLDYWRQRVVFSQADVLNIMRTFRSLPSIFPKGGNVVWGDSISAPDDTVEGERDDPETNLNPTRDYPGGTNQTFVTSQATAERKDRSKYEDKQRMEQAKRREPSRIQGQGLGENQQLDDDDEEEEDDEDQDIADQEPSRKDNATTDAVVAEAAPAAAAPASAPTHRSYLGHFLSFTHPVPWPFPNITRVVEEMLETQRRARNAQAAQAQEQQQEDQGAGAGAKLDKKEAQKLKERVQHTADTGKEPAQDEAPKKTHAPENGQFDQSLSALQHFAVQSCVCSSLTLLSLFFVSVCV